jgi:hypothetical protein
MSSVQYVPAPPTVVEQEEMLRVMLPLPKPPIKIDVDALHERLMAAVCKIAKMGIAAAYALIMLTRAAIPAMPDFNHPLRSTVVLASAITIASAFDVI